MLQAKRVTKATYVARPLWFPRDQFDFWSLEGLTMWIAKVLFVVFLAIFIMSLIADGRSYYPP